MSNSIEEFGKELSKRMQDMIKGSKAPVIELGRINENGALTVDSFGEAIPRGEYMISGRIQQQQVIPGSRVVVAWSGTEPIVIDTVSSS